MALKNKLEALDDFRLHMRSHNNCSVITVSAKTEIDLMTNLVEK